MHEQGGLVQLFKRHRRALPERGQGLRRAHRFDNVRGRGIEVLCPQQGRDLLCDCAVRGHGICGERKLRKIAVIEHVGNAFDERLVGNAGNLDYAAAVVVEHADGRPAVG